jgi:hypothetical protein
MFELLQNEYNQDPLPQIFFGFMENTEFKEKFIARNEYLVKNLLTSERMLEQINLFEARFQTEINRHIARWRQPGSFLYWQKNVDIMKDFAKERPAIVLEQLKAL